MGLTLVTAPAGDPITLAEVKLHLRVDATDEDDLIEALIDAAVARLDGKDGILGRALVTQTWDYTIDDDFPDEIALPLPPLQSVTSITYVDSAGDTQTLAADQYRVLTDRTPGLIVPAQNVTWPTPREQKAAVTVRFVAGCAPDDSVSPVDYGANVPAPIKTAMKLMIGHWYANREAVNVGNIVNEMPLSANRLLASYKVWSFG